MLIYFLEFKGKICRKNEADRMPNGKDVSLLWLSGLSTRGIELVSKTMLGPKISNGEVSHINQELLTGIDSWRTRDLSNFPIKYLYVDGVNFAMRTEHRIEKIPMLVVVGVRKDNNQMMKYGTVGSHTDIISTPVNVQTGGGTTFHNGTLSGAYRFIRHPAYVSKNLAWLLMGLPGVFQGGVKLFYILDWMGIYFLRALTEERPGLTL